MVPSAAMSESEGHALSAGCYVLLAAMGWVDGEMAPEEAEAIVRAAQEDLKDPAQLQRVRDAVSKREPLEELDTSAMGAYERLYTYALASWITRIDGKVVAGERDLLGVVGTVLRLTHKGRAEVDALVEALLEKAPEHRPGRLDLAALRGALGDKVREASKRHPG